MTKEVIAIIGLGLTLIAAAAGYGMQIGQMAERIETQSKTIDGLTAEVRAINGHFIAWTIQHAEPTPPRRTR